MTDKRPYIYVYKLRMMAGGSRDCVNCLRRLDRGAGSEDDRHLCAVCKLEYQVTGYSENHPPPENAYRDDKPGLMRWYGRG